MMQWSRCVLVYPGQSLSQYYISLWDTTTLRQELATLRLASAYKVCNKLNYYNTKSRTQLLSYLDKVQDVQILVLYKYMYTPQCTIMSCLFVCFLVCLWLSSDLSLGSVKWLVHRYWLCTLLFPLEANYIVYWTRNPGIGGACDRYTWAVVYVRLMRSLLGCCWVVWDSETGEYIQWCLPYLEVCRIQSLYLLTNSWPNWQNNAKSETFSLICL